MTETPTARVAAFGGSRLVSVRFVRVVLLMLLSLAPAVGWSGGGGGITYVYDENGRLIAVVDPAAALPNARVYHYDGAGNLLSIEQSDTSTVSILSFAPPCGSAGTSVTISGTGFSATANQNTVTFPGAAGVAPMSATLTQLVVTVPAGATTGTISVTTPYGTQSSATAFRVDGCGAPTITDFTTVPGQTCTPPCPGRGSCLQHVGLPGTAVTITGTNFDAMTTSNNLPAFNNQMAIATAATATRIDTNVPPIGTSGKVRVSTPLGTALSPTDFFAPPPGKTVADMDLCNLERIGTPPPGGSTLRTLKIETTGKISELLFDGVGRAVCINITSPQCDGVGCDLGFELRTPTGDRLLDSGSIVNTPTTRFFDTVTLAAAGSYAAVLTSATKGQTDIRIYDVPPDPTQFITLTATGTALTLANSSACQNARAYFPETAGHRVSVKLTAVSGSGALTLFNGEPIPSIANPINNLWSPRCTDPGCLPFVNPLIESAALPVDGQYLFLFDAGTVSPSASVTFTAYDVQDRTQPTLSVTNPNPVTITLSTPGQNALLPISGITAGSLTVHVTSNNNGFTTNNCVTVSLVDTTTNTTLASVNSGSMPTSSCSTAFDLPQTTVNGTDSYAVSIDPSRENTGSLAVRVAQPS